MQSVFIFQLNTKCMLLLNLCLEVDVKAYLELAVFVTTL